MVFVGCVAWYFSSPEGNSHYGVSDAHDKKWKAVDQHYHNDMIPAMKKGWAEECFQRNSAFWLLEGKSAAVAQSVFYAEWLGLCVFTFFNCIQIYLCSNASTLWGF